MEDQIEKKSRYLAVIGASAGGPKAVLTVLKDLPATTCGILVIQHLSHGFSRKFAEYLDPQCRMRVKEARSGEAVCDGTVYIAPDGYQMTLGKLEDGFTICCTPGKRYGGFCPSISYTMFSAAETVKEKALGIILTGMGEDGSKGLLAMRQAGARTVAQDRETSEIYSMPESAFRNGGAERQLELGLIGREITRFCMNMKNKTGRQVMKKPLIMIADDAMFMRRVIKRALTQGGYDNFVEAGDGVEAVAKYKETQPDLMLLDITMPGRSGLEVLNDILTLNGNAKVIMCSAVGQEQVIAEAIRCGASDFIIKPFKDEEILKIVRACL